MRKSKNRSTIEELGKEHLRKVISESSGMSEVIRAYGLCDSGGCSRTVLKRLSAEWNIPLVFTKKVVRNSVYKRSRKEIFCINSMVSRNLLKRTVINEGLKNSTQCSICGIGNVWNEIPIVMIIDHINGVNNDNRLENLRFICPNCNSQLLTTGSRNKIAMTAVHSKEEYFCKTCGKKVSDSTCKYCRDCFNIKQRKVERPSTESLKKDLSTMSFCAVGRKYGVSDNAIRKWLRGTIA